MAVGSTMHEQGRDKMIGFKGDTNDKQWQTPVEEEQVRMGGTGSELLGAIWKHK